MPLSTSIYKKKELLLFDDFSAFFWTVKPSYHRFRNIDHIIGHPDYSAATITNDACLLKLKVDFGWLLNLCNINLEPFRSHLNGQSSSNPSLCQPQCRWYLLSCKAFSATNENRYIADYKTLISTDQDTAAGSMVTVTGWGTTSEGALGLPNVLHKVILVLVFPMSSILWCSRQRCKKWQTRQTCLC